MLQNGENCMIITNLCNENWFDELEYCLSQYDIESAALSKYLDSENTIRLRN